MAAAAILKKNEKSLYLGNGSTDFDQIWHLDPCSRFTGLTDGQTDRPTDRQTTLLGR